MAIVLDFICRLELFEPDACLELEEAIDELEGFGVSRFSVCEKRKLNFSEKAQNLKSVEK